MSTIQERLATALKSRGWTKSLVQPSRKYIKYEHFDAKFAMWLGKAGALRRGRIATATIRVNPAYRLALLANPDGPAIRTVPAVLDVCPEEPQAMIDENELDKVYTARLREYRGGEVGKTLGALYDVINEINDALKQGIRPEMVLDMATELHLKGDDLRYALVRRIQCEKRK